MMTDLSISTAPPTPGVSGALGAAGVLFVLYPAIRPFSDETSLRGAAAFASGPWLAAHSLAMAAFVLLVAGFLGLHLRHQGEPVARLSLHALMVSGTGVALALAFYGAETFGLAAIGQAAHDRGDRSLLAVADAVRLGPGIAFLAVGLLLLAVGGSMIAATIWRSDEHLRWRGIPLAVGLALYLPQFLAPQPVRVGHGVLMALGCLLLRR